MNETLVIDAVRKTVTVDCSVEEAFRVFTVDARSWWPVAEHSIHGEKVTDIVFEGREGGAVYELAADGAKGHWATVVAFEPPNRLALSWEVGERALGTEVEIRFAPEGSGTRVDLEHRGWESEQLEARSDYDAGWERVLGSYGRDAVSG